MPAGYVGFYAEQDAALTLKLWHRFKAEIQQQSINDVWEMEMELLPILVKMRQIGLRVDEGKAAILKKEFRLKEKEVLHKIKKETTLNVDIWAARSVAQVFDRIGVDYARTPKSNEPSFNSCLILDQVFNSRTLS